jgi:SPOR domain
MRMLLLVPVIIFYSSLIWADKYTIQVGAFHKVSEQTLSSVVRYGTYQQEKKGDLMRLMVGSFHSRQDAEALLVEIKKSFPQAFIRLVDQQENVANHHHLDEKATDHQHPHFDGKEMKKWQNLTAEQQDHAVYLDGKLHLKYGDHFTPVK